MVHRTDISDYVIHTTRCPKVEDYPDHKRFDEDWYLPLCEDVITNEYYSLINIIQEGGLRASFSFRNGKETIYGGDPVVCFTEMPLLNMLQYVAQRHNRTRFTEYGVALLKKEVYKNGGRPVIYGLSNDNPFRYKVHHNKLIDESVLPLFEQYRYVAFDLDNGIDWTHEREWRIKCPKTSQLMISDEVYQQTFNTPGLNIFSDEQFSEVVIIVNTKEEAQEIQEIVQQQLDCGYSKGGEEFCCKIKYLVIDCALEYLKNNKITSIEELPIRSFYLHSYETLTDEEKAKTNSALKYCLSKANEFATEFFRVTTLGKDSDGFIKDICGSAFIASYETSNKYVRFLLEERLAHSLGQCVLLKNMLKDIPGDQSLTYAEYIAQKQCEYLNKEIADVFTVYSIRD